MPVNAKMNDRLSEKYGIAGGRGAYKCKRKKVWDMPEYFSRAAALLPEPLRAAAAALPARERAVCEAIRLRTGRPPTLRLPEGERTFAAAPVTAETLSAVLERATGASMHAYADELRRGFLCAPGGVRVGVCGTAVCTPDAIRTLRDVSSLCIRVARPVPGAGRELLPMLAGKSVLVLSPPGGGKTTFLRELVRVSSDAGTRVALADERGELAGMAGGAPGFDVGRCTDVLTGAPKAEAALLLLRSMAPEVVAMDEVNAPEDAAAVETLLGCGVRIFASAHAPDRAALLRRPVFRRLMARGAFDVLVRISGTGRARTYAAEAP